MLIISLDDIVEKRAKVLSLSKKVRVGTNISLYSGLGYLIATGVVSLPLLGELVFIGCVNRATRWVIKNKVYKRGEVNPLPLN